MYKECPLCGDASFKRINVSPKGDKNIASSKVFVCCGCEFIFKVSDGNYENKDIEYYDNYQTVDKLTKRSQERALTDYSRYNNYIDLMARFVNLEESLNSLDIGGAEGLFSSLLKDRFYSIRTHNLEPDQMAIEVGQSLYPDVRHLDCKLEDVGRQHIANKFDVVTYWGGLYRTKDPISALQGLTSHLADEAYLFFSFPFFYENPSRQDDTPYPSVNYILGNDSWFMPSLDHLQFILEKFFYFVEPVWIQNIPFKKDIPVFVCRYSIETKPKLVKMERRISNIEKLISFATKHTADQILTVAPGLEKKRVAIICEEATEIYWLKVFRHISGDIFFVRQRRDESNNEINVIDFGQIWGKEISALFLLDSLDDAVRNQVIGRLHLDKFIDVYLLSRMSSDLPYFDIEGESFLGCIFGAKGLGKNR